MRIRTQYTYGIQLQAITSAERNANKRKLKMHEKNEQTKHKPTAGNKICTFIQYWLHYYVHCNCINHNNDVMEVNANGRARRTKNSGKTLLAIMDGNINIITIFSLKTFSDGADSLLVLFYVHKTDIRIHIIENVHLPSQIKAIVYNAEKWN